jgi:3-oxo-5-alpha-steroid 4-dehydrogenase 1
MSPMHIFVWLSAIGFQVLNATSLGSWLAAYGPVTASAWDPATGGVGLPQFCLGVAVFYAGLAANFFHDEELRQIRRREARRQREQGKAGGGVAKHYRIPEAGLFRYMLYPHYFCEWIEWTGFWIAAGWGCTPARAFLVNEIFTMLPRAVNGRAWYAETFGEDKIKHKYAVIPGIL